VTLGRVAPTRSELERAFLRAVLKAGLPPPEVNQRVGPYVVDFAWPERRVVVETDDERFHGHHAAIRRGHGPTPSSSCSAGSCCASPGRR